MADFNLTDLYNAAFGYIQKPGYTGITGGAPTAQANVVDQLQRTVLRGGKEGLYGERIAMPCSIGGIDLPNEPLISINLAKLIVETAIDGNDGLFKENYSNGDYQVTIEGLALDDNDPDNYPEEIIRNIRRVTELRTHIPITCALTTLFNITHIAVKGVEFKAFIGDIGVQPYVINCASDREYPLTYKPTT